jgi:hypothetical protein
MIKKSQKWLSLESRHSEYVLSTYVRISIPGCNDLNFEIAHF